MTDNFKDYGFNFQMKLIAALLTDQPFLQQIFDILDTKYFESESSSWIVDTTKNYFSKYKKSPTFEVLKIKLLEVSSDTLKTMIIDNMREVWKFVGSTDLDFIKEKALDFCKNQNMKNAILESADLLKTNDYDKIKQIIDASLKVGTERNVGHIYKEDIEARFGNVARPTVATPWDAINDITDGGLGPGELGIIMANPEAGKTWTLINIGVHAIINGLSVVHYTMELSEAYIGLRYDARLTKIAASNLKYHKDDIEAHLKKLKGNLIIKEYPVKSASVSTLTGHLEKLSLIDVVPDLILVDYADLLLSSHVKGMKLELRHIISNIYEELRRLAGEKKVPLWSCSQANRASSELDVIEGDKIAEAYNKLAIADFIISLSRRTADKIAGTGRWYIVKNRFGPSGNTYPSSMNLSNGVIEIYEESSSGGKIAISKMDDSSEYLRKLLAKKKREMENG